MKRSEQDAGACEGAQHEANRIARCHGTLQRLLIVSSLACSVFWCCLGHGEDIDGANSGTVSADASASMVPPTIHYLRSNLAYKVH